MKTHRNASASRGDVIDTRSAVSGQSYGPVIVTDPSRPVEGGRAATPAEMAQAKAEGRFQTRYQ